MSGKLRILSGKDLIKIFKEQGFVVHDQSGSHIKLRRELSGARQTLIIPNHSPIAKGTLKGIFNQASKYVSQDNLMKYFYD